MPDSKYIEIGKLVTPEWNEDFEIGISEIDLQHKNFLKLVKKVELLGKGKFREINIEDIFQEIIFYAQFHFRSEENLMKEFAYPDIEKHRSEHKILSDHLLLEVSELMVHPTNFVHLHNYLLKWLLEHIILEDKKLSNYLEDITELNY